MKLPTEVYLGIQVFDIQFRDRNKDGMLSDESTLGYTLDQQSLIVIDSTLAVSKQRVTLMHELMHAAYMVFGGPTHPDTKATVETWEHHFIGVWENSILMMLTDPRNKELTDWLFEQGNELENKNKNKNKKGIRK